MSLPPHERVLPDVDVSEPGLRQLELWLLDRLKGVRGFTLAKLGSAKLSGDVTLSEGTDISLTQSGQNIEIASTVVPGDYIFVAEASPASSAFTFTGIPQDARHLVIFLDFWFASTVPTLIFNNDTTAANYRTVSETTQDYNGTVTKTISSPGFGAAGGIPLSGMDGEKPNRAVITIPYYRFRRSSGDFDRSIEIESWARTENAISVISLVRHTKETGWWQAATSAASVITSIKLSIAGGDGRASLYKIL